MLSSGGMTARLDRLERQGLVERRPNPDDRRGTRVALTARGVALVEAALPVHLANQTRLVSALSAKELATLSRLLGKLLRHADASRPPSGKA